MSTHALPQSSVPAEHAPPPPEPLLEELFPPVEGSLPQPKGPLAKPNIAAAKAAAKGTKRDRTLMLPPLLRRAEVG